MSSLAEVTTPDPAPGRLALAAYCAMGVDAEAARLGAALLERLGVNPAAPAPRTGYTPGEVSRRFAAFAEPGGAARAGRAWEIAASDVIVENAARAPYAWPDTAPAALAFWERATGGVGLLATYAPLPVVLARRLEADELAAGGVDEAARAWRRYAEGLLAAVRARPDHAVLIPESALRARPDEAARLMAERFGLTAPASPLAPGLLGAGAARPLEAHLALGLAPSTDAALPEQRAAMDGGRAVLRVDAKPIAATMLRCLADVRARMPDEWTMQPIGEAAEAELMNWDAEEYRQKLAGRT